MRWGWLLRLNLFLAFCFITQVMCAQSIRQQKADSVFRLLRKYLELKDIDKLYALTGNTFRTMVPPDAFHNIATQQLFPLGGMIDTDFESFVNDKTATYKVQFNGVTMEIILSLDDKDKLDGLLFRPYQPAPPDKLMVVPTSNPLKTPLDKMVDAAATKYINRANTVGLCIGVIKNGQINIYGYGETIKGGKHLPDAETIFEIGSITKTFTATILAIYVNQGKLKLSDPMIKFLPDSVAINPALKDITLVNLINHTSGLPSVPSNLALQSGYDKADPYKNYNKQLLFDWLKNVKLLNPPGAHYAYSNAAVGLLGVILEKLSGKPYEQLVSEMICAPLGMKSTVQHLYPMMVNRSTALYTEAGEQTPPWDFDALAACGALRSDMNDLILYAKANLNDDRQDAVSKALKLTHQITFDQQPNIGLAWHIILVEGVPYYFHNGGTYGSSSFLAFNKEKNLAVICLSNAETSTDNLGVELLKLLQ